MTVLAIVLALLAATPRELPSPVRLSAPVLDRRAVLEVRDLPADEARAAIRTAVERMQHIETLLDPRGTVEGGVGRVNAAAGVESRTVAPEVVSLLGHSLGFCYWSDGAWGPLAGSLFDLWREAAAGGLPPSDRQRVDAARTAACDTARLDAATRSVTLSRGTRIELRPFAAGYLVDQAIEVLRRRGASNGYVELGMVKAGFGPGPAGEGWRVDLGPIGAIQGLDRVRLRDRALAVAHRGDGAIVVDGAVLPRFFDQRPARQVLSDGSSVPRRTVVAVATSTTLAADAEALAGALFVLGSASGQIYLGSVEPEPSVLWVLGDDPSGSPALTTHDWTLLLR